MNLCKYELLLICFRACKMTADRKGNYAVKVSGVEMSPDPVVRGKPATFSISASTGKVSISRESLISMTVILDVIGL